MSDAVDKFSFDLTFQKKILHLLVTDISFLINSIKYLKKEYFDGNILPWMYSTIVNYYKGYNKLVTSSVLVTEIKKLPPEENMLEYAAIAKEIISIEVLEKEYVIDKVKEFIQRNIFVRGYKKVQDIFNEGRFDESLGEMNVCLDAVGKVSFENPHRFWFFEEVNERMARRNTQLMTEAKIMSGIPCLDTLTGGGLAHGELAIIGGDAGKGKSIFLMNVGAWNARGWRKVVHFSLEGKAGQVENRYEARLLHENYNDVVQNTLRCDPKKSYRYHSKSLVIVELLDRWDYTIEDIERELIELKNEDFIPELIIIDYGDLLAPRSVNKDNTYLAQGEVFRDLKTLAAKSNSVVWTATQFGRATKDEKPDTDINFIWTRKKLADSYAKIRPADLFVTLNMTQIEQKSNRMRLFFDKYRDSLGGGDPVTIKTDFAHMFFTRPSEADFAYFARGNIR